MKSVATGLAKTINAASPDGSRDARPAGRVRGVAARFESAARRPLPAPLGGGARRASRAEDASPRPSGPDGRLQCVPRIPGLPVHSAARGSGGRSESRPRAPVHQRPENRPHVFALAPPARRVVARGHQSLGSRIQHQRPCGLERRGPACRCGRTHRHRGPRWRPHRPRGSALHAGLGLGESEANRGRGLDSGDRPRVRGSRGGRTIGDAQSGIDSVPRSPRSRKRMDAVAGTESCVRRTHQLGTQRIQDFQVLRRGSEDARKSLHRASDGHGP